MMEEIREMAEEAKAQRPSGGDLELPARRRRDQGRRDGDGHLRLRRAHGGAARRAHHQGQAADRGDRAGRGEEGLRGAEDSTSRRRRSASRTSCRPASTAGASSSSRAARRRATTAIFADAKAIHEGGGNGSIIGRNTFQRPRDKALELLAKLIEIYKS
jgi:hypothetical protein